MLNRIQAQQKATGSLGGKRNAEKLPALQEDLQRQEIRLQESAPAYLNDYQQFDFGRLTSIKEVRSCFASSSSSAQSLTDPVLAVLI